MTLESNKETEDKESITLAYADYKKGLNNYAYHRLTDLVKSEDLVQDTFVKTWGYLVRGGKIEVMQAFLYRVLNHLIIDDYRKRKSISLDLMRENGFEPGTGNNERLFALLDGKAALLLIQRLPLKYQKIMRMRYIQDLSIQEMGLITGQSKNMISVQIHRGVAKLKLLYSPL